MKLLPLLACLALCGCQREASYSDLLRAHEREASYSDLLRAHEREVNSWKQAVLAAAENGYLHGQKHSLLTVRGIDDPADSLEATTNAIAIGFWITPPAATYITP